MGQNDGTSYQQAPASDPILRDFQRVDTAEEETTPMVSELAANADVKDRHWHRYGSTESPDIFAYHFVSISHDGGLKDVQNLLYSTQYFYALGKLLGVVLNCYVIAQVDINAVLGYTDPEILEASRGFLATERIAEITLDKQIDGMWWIQVFELSYMAFNMSCVLLCLISGLLAPWMSQVNGRHYHLNRWSFIAHMFWIYFQELVSFSALKLLYYVTPLVFSTQVYNMIVMTQERVKLKGWESVQGLMYAFTFLVSRIVFLIIGFDSFLVKLRITAHNALEKEPSYFSILVVLMFLFQILGAVKINVFLQERFYIFLFGGQDGQLDHDEVMLVEIWQAIVTRKIFKTFGIFGGTVVMLGFDDYDFQMLALDDKETEIRQQEMKNEVKDA